MLHTIYSGLLFTVLFLLHSHPDHYSTSSKYSAVDMNMARLLFHRVVQQDHPEIAQQVSGHKNISMYYLAVIPLVYCLIL